MTDAAMESKRQYMREYMKRYRKKNRERINAKQREWNAKNPDKVKAYSAAYWERKAMGNSQ